MWARCCDVVETDLISNLKVAFKSKRLNKPPEIKYSFIKIGSNAVM